MSDNYPNMVVDEIDWVSRYSRENIIRGILSIIITFMYRIVIGIITSIIEYIL